MANEETQILDYHERNNRFWGNPEYMEDYWLKNGYEWRDWLLQPKIDPRSLNDGGIPTNNYNMPAQPGLNMMPLNARLQVGSKYLDQCNISGYVVKNFDGSWGNLTKIPLINKIDSLDDINHEWHQGNMKDFATKKFFEKEIVGKIDWQVKDWYLEIPQNWNYIIYYVVEFFHDKNRDPVDSHYKMYAEITLHNNSGIPDYIGRESKYTITLPDYISWTIVSNIKARQKIWISCMLKAVDNCFVRTFMSVIKLSQ